MQKLKDQVFLQFKELIVVIKIIIILSGRLLPTLQSARDKARMYYYINYANAIPILQLESRRLIIFYICKNNIGHYVFRFNCQIRIVFCYLCYMQIIFFHL